MTTRRLREFYKVQLLETQRLLDTVKDHPIMSFAFNKRKEDIQLRLADLPIDQKEAKVSLLFSGKPVKGSLGIDAVFAGQVVVPFQMMVKSDFAHRVHGKVGERGRINSEEQSRLFVTALPRGSFGIELSKLDHDSLFDEDQLADSLAHIAKLVDSSARSDEDFAAELDDVAPRTIQNLKDFLEIVSHDNAGVSIESGGIRVSLKPDEAKTAFDRVAGTETKDKVVDVNGIFKGVLLESWRFDFLDDDGNKITGKIDEGLSEELVSNYLINYFNKKSIASLQEEKVLFKNGREKTSYTLKGLKGLDS